MKRIILISVVFMSAMQTMAQKYFDVYQNGVVKNSIATSSLDSIGLTGSTEQDRMVLFYKGDNSVNSYLTSSIDSIKVRRQSEKLKITVKGVSFNMVMVSGGTFQMGAKAEEIFDEDPDPDWALPVHQVTLSDYYIGETEVTQELWKAVMGSNPSYFKTSNQLPVEKVSWNDCQTFIKKLNQLTGKQFRLPTEAEWEFAARGGNLSQGYKYSGSDGIGSVAWYLENSGSKTHKVGTKSPNELGIFDMSGNVAEWCKDWDGDYSSNPQTNPSGPSSGIKRIHRGGRWDSEAWRCRVYKRGCFTTNETLDNLGLRLAL